MIARTKEDQKLKFPSFYLSEQELDIITNVKYLRHIIRNDLNVDDDDDDDDDIQRPIDDMLRQICWQANFIMCTDEVKTAL